MNGEVHELSEALDDSLDLLGQLTGGREDECLGLLKSRVDGLEHSNGESPGLSCSGLRLGDSVLALDDGQDPLLLNLRGLVITIAVDSPEKVRVEVEVLESVDRFEPVGLDFATGDQLLGRLTFLSGSAFARGLVSRRGFVYLTLLWF